MFHFFFLIWRMTKSKKKVDSTTPPSDVTPTPEMATLDPKEVDAMIKKNGLNEVTLKVRQEV